MMPLTALACGGHPPLEKYLLFITLFLLAGMVIEIGLHYLLSKHRNMVKAGNPESTADL